MSNKPTRLYAVEFLRIWAIILIILLHALLQYPVSVRESVTSSLFGASSQFYAFGVEFFFVVGGFFLYRRANANQPFVVICKIYKRLIPGLLFAFLLCWLFSNIKFVNILTVFTLLGGTALQPFSMMSGEWFISAYFWSSCLLIGLFCAPRWVSILLLALLVYVLLCLRVHFPISQGGGGNYSMLTYNSVIGTYFARSIYCMSLGAMSGFLADKIHLPQNRLGKILGTLAEAYCLFLLFNYMARPSHVHGSYIQMLATLCFVVVSISKSWGYISMLMNSFRWIQYASRYVFPSLMGHIIVMNIMSYHKFWGLEPYSGILLIVICSIAFGIVEFHLIENYLMRFLEKYLFQRN